MGLKSQGYKNLLSVLQRELQWAHQKHNFLALKNCHQSWMQEEDNRPAATTHTPKPSACSYQSEHADIFMWLTNFSLWLP